ncbi:MAG: hypothetical protein ACU83V_06825 [Gammaproteobacteria bacterium]
MTLLFYALLPLYVCFCLWLGYRIIEKAGFDGWWTLALLIPVVNLVMIWVFAFMAWPTLKEGIKQDL